MNANFRGADSGMKLGRKLLDHVSTAGRRVSARATVVALCVMFGGCTVGPDFSSPGPPNVGSLTNGRLHSPGSAGGVSQTFVLQSDIPGEWWRLFGSRPLNALIEEALQNNPDLASAEATLRSAHANVEAERGLFFPQLSADYSSTRQKVSTDPLVPSTANGSPYYTTHTAQLAITYLPDVFGGTRRQVEALRATAEVQRFQLEATQLTLTANLALAAIQEASLRGQIEAIQNIIRIEKELLELQKKQRTLGQIGEIDVATQETALAQAEQTLPPLEKQLSQQRDQIIALTGHLPGEGLPTKFDFARLGLPAQIPVSLASDIVRQRPDVRAAEANMHAACAQVGVAIANRLPQFNLVTNGGTMSSAISNVLNFSTPYSFWTIAGSASQVLFDGFTLEQRQRAAEAGLDQAAAQYRSAVVTGFQNVADSLQALDYDARTMRAAVVGARAAEKSLTLIRKQLAFGQVSSVQVLNAQQAYLQASIAVVQAKAGRYADTVALFQALGGGWWNRADVRIEPVGHPWWDLDIHRADAENRSFSKVAAR